MKSNILSTYVNSETKVFIGCLRGTTGTGCTGTEIVQLITEAETKLTGIPDSACGEILPLLHTEQPHPLIS